MSLLVNDLSFHGQFHDLHTFRVAVDRLMIIREVARRFGRDLQCHKGMASALVMPGVTMPQAILALAVNEQRALRSWFTKNGPFWEDARTHGPDDYLELNGNVVTDTAVGETAWCRLNNIDRSLVSLAPSKWQFSPLSIEWTSNGNIKKAIDVANHWDAAALEDFLKDLPVPIETWSQLETLTIARCPMLTFAKDAFSPLNGYPFISGAAQRMLAVLMVLNRFKSCFDENGQRTPEGHEIYQDFFTGVKEGGGRGATFSDSSDTEKEEFGQQLTFAHPDQSDRSIFCTWHGKVQTPQLRTHFSWPVRADEPLYVLYVGPKITKR